MTRNRRLNGVAMIAGIVAIATACGSGPTDEAEPPIGTTTSPIESSPARSSVASDAISTPATTSTTATTATASDGVDDEQLVALETPGQCVDQLELDAVAALTVWPAVGPGQWDDATVAVGDIGVGGLVLFEPTDSTADEVEQRLADLEAMSHHGLVVATDEEGGVVQRLSVVGDLASQNALGTELGPGDELATVIRTHGEAVRALGVDVVFGPVVDVAPESGPVPLAASRFFPGDGDDVAALAATYVDAWNDAGLIATLKHFPGHGAASADTHDTGATTPDLATLERRDLVPYRTLGDQVADGRALVMVGHLTVPDLTDGLPATRSPAAIEFLRSIAGYENAVVVSDALGMGAVGLDEADASVAALAAGIDVVIFTRTDRTADVVAAIVDAVDAGQLSDERLRRSAQRVMALLERDGHSCDAPAS